MWDQTRFALDFFQTYLPFNKMKSSDNLTASTRDFCFSKQGDRYAVYLPEGGSGEIDLRSTEGTFSVQWYNPRRGGKLTSGSVAEIEGGKIVSFGEPPGGSPGDWVVLISR